MIKMYKSTTGKNKNRRGREDDYVRNSPHPQSARVMMRPGASDG